MMATRGNLPLIGLVLVTAGCTTPGRGKVADTCTAGPGQAFIGRSADAGAGARILKATRSRELRWFAPPQNVVTTEYKFGRVTIDLDENGTIRNVTCG